MKNLIITFTMALVLTILVFCQTSLLSESIRYDETRQSLSYAVERAIDAIQVMPTYELKTDEDLAFAFISNVSKLIESNSDIGFQIVTSDVENGLLDIIVTEQFVHSNGKVESITLRKSVIIDSLLIQ